MSATFLQRKIYAPLVACSLLISICYVSLRAQNAPARSQSSAHHEATASAISVIQGRITSVQGTLLTIKTPDAYPGGTGIHAQFVLAGPTFKVDVSNARVLLPDGRSVDARPLAVGDRVLMVLKGFNSSSLTPGALANLQQKYFATIVERIAASDKIVTH
jgi:hypothetical protein